MRKENIKNYLLTSLVSLSSLFFAQIVNAESDIIGHWSRLPTPQNMPKLDTMVEDYDRGIIYILKNGGEFWKYSIQDNEFTQIPTINFPEERHDYIYNPDENSIWFTHVGKGATYRLPVTGGNSEYIGGSGDHWDCFNTITYWNPCNKKFSIMFGYGFGTVKNWWWQFGIGDDNWNLAQENQAGREPWQRTYTSMAQDLNGKRIFVGLGIGNSSGRQYELNPSFVNNRDYDYLRDLWCLNLEDNTWENLIPLNTIKPLRGKLVYHPIGDTLFLLNTFTSTALPGDQIYGEYEQLEEGVWMMRLGRDSNFIKIETDGEAPNARLDAYPNYDPINKRILYMNSDGVYALSLEGLGGDNPQIIAQPQNQTVMAGDSVTFSVTVAVVPLTYQWYKDGFMLQGAIDREYTIDSVNQSDAGQYFVVVSNEFASVTSDVATLTVNAPLAITQQPVGVRVQGGESATFSVEAENATSYQWYRDGFAIAGADQSSYTIGAVTSYDIGKYFVIVSNERTSIASDVATLEISEAYRAKAEAIVANGFVIGFVITDPGWGYEWTPKVRVKDEFGEDAEAHCIVENGMVVGIVVDNPGSGYSEETYVKVGSPYKFNSLNVQVTEVEIKMHLNLGRKYQLECTEDNIHWEKVGEPFIAEDEEIKLRLEVVDRIRYFRVHEVK